MAAHGGRSERAFPAQPHGEQPNLAVPKAHNVIGELTHRRAVGDAHARRSRYVLGLVDDDHRQMPLLDDGQIRIVIRCRVDDEAVDESGEAEA